MIIQRAAPTILFLTGLNNNAGVSLFLCSQVNINEHLIELLEIFLSSFPDIKALLEGFSIFNGIWALLAASLVRILCFFIFLFIKRSFIEQGSLMFKEARGVIKNGLSAYLILVSVIIVFFISAVGIPVALVLFAVAYIIALIGEASISVAMGRVINRKINKFPPRIESDLFIGAVLLELTKLVPIVNLCIYIFIIPVISIGVVITSSINGFIKKVFYMSDYSEDNSGNNFNNKSVRDIILGNQKGGGCDEKEKI